MNVKVHSALLEGAPQGEARQIWWDEKLAFQFDESDDEEERAATPSTTPAANTADSKSIRPSEVLDASTSSPAEGAQTVAPAERREAPDADKAAVVEQEMAVGGDSAQVP